MSDHGEFVEAALNHAWGARAEVHLPDMSVAVRDGDVGFLTFFGDEYVKWSSTVKANVPLNAELLDAVSEINTALPVGQISVRPDGLLIWSYKLLPHWIDTESSVSARMLVEICSNVPTFVRMCRERLASSGGDAYTPDDIGVLIFFG